MGMFLKEEEIVEYLQEKRLQNAFTENTMVYAQIMPSNAQLFFFGAYAQLVKGNYFVMCVDENRIILIQLNKVTGKINRKLEPTFISFDEIDDIHIKNGMILYTVTLKGVDGEEVPLKLNKKGLGMPWHKNNLEKALNRLENI